MAESKRRPLVSILGDSISTFEGCNPEGFDVFYEGERCLTTGVVNRKDTWWQLVIDALDGELLANGSFSGSMVEGAGFPAASSAERIEALSRNGLMPDIVIVFIGINDYGWGGAANQAAARARATPAAAPACEERVAGAAPLDAAESFARAYDSMLSRVRAAYPDAQVWCSTLCPGRLTGADAPTFIRRLRGIDVASYDQAIRDAAVGYGCKVVDLAAAGREYDAIDGTHPTALGMRQLAALMLESMGEQGIVVDAQEAGLSLQDVFGACDMRADDFCACGECIGCAFARATGNAWSLVCEKGPKESK
ncbi:MAG: SGNH/GDSL hydrolase family protein [Slackia sp.]|nr:SGNH/GDSL hydrolase family protein [Slackia sp.]